MNTTLSVPLLPSSSQSPTPSTSAPLLNFPLSLSAVACPSPAPTTCQETLLPLTQSSAVSIPMGVPNTIVLSGTGFDPSTRVQIGGVPCSPPSPYLVTNSQYSDSTDCPTQCPQLTCVIQTDNWGTNTIVALNSNGEAAELLGQLTVMAPPPLITSTNFTSGSTAGGTNFVILGSQFLSGAIATLGPTLGVTPADGEFTCTSPSYILPFLINCITPPHAAGTVNVTVTNPDGQSTSVILVGAGPSPSPSPVTFTYISPTVAPSDLGYLFNPAMYPLAYPSPSPTPIASNVPQYLGSHSNISFQIVPSPVPGMVFDTNTGIITGIPSSPIPMTNFLVGVSNSAGSTTTQLAVSVTDFGPGNTPAPTFSGSTIVNNYTYITDTNPSGSSFHISSTGGRVPGAGAFSPGDMILVIQMQNPSAFPSPGLPWEIAQISPTWTPSTTVTLTASLKQTYGSGSANTSTQIIRMPQYHDLTLPYGSSITAPSWDGTTGGVIAFRANGVVTVNGTVNASGLGFRGGSGQTNGTAFQGETWAGTGSASNSAFQGAGGGGSATGSQAASGGGGGYGTSGADGVSAGSGTGGSGGQAFSVADGLINLLLGSGGGGAAFGTGCLPQAGSNGGGIILIFAYNLQVGSTGAILATGQNSVPDPGGSSCVGDAGGAGSGGSIYFQSALMNLGTGQVNASGGRSDMAGSGGKAQGGAGGDGRIRLDFGVLSGTTTPAPGALNSL